MAHCKNCHDEMNQRAAERRLGRTISKKPPKDSPTKVCSGCEQELPKTAFGSKASKWGPLLRAKCRTCHAAETKAEKLANPERVRASNARYRAENAAVLRERQRQWAREHPERYRSIHSKWKQANKELVNAATWRRRYAIQANGGVIITADEWIAVKARYGGHCLMCGKTPYELCYDHVVPCSPPHNGPMDVSNGQPLCRPCNSRKHVAVLDLRPGSPFDQWPDLPIGTVELSRVEQLGQPV